MNSLKRKRESRQLLWYILFCNHFSWLINFGAAQNGQFINCRDTNWPAHLKWEPSKVRVHWTIIGPIVKLDAELPFSNLTVDLQHRARSRAFFIPITTSENERFLRTYHQSLEPHQIVYRIKDVRGHEMWAISFEGSAPVHDTYAAGLPIHVLPSFIVPPRVPQQRLLNDPIIGVINPREILSLGNLYLIHTFFPNSIGVRILVTGFIIILYKSMKDLKDAWTQGVLETVGTLQVGYSVAVYVPTATSIGYGSAVTTKEDGDMYENQGCLGLRIRLPNGNEAITTTTHAFVRLMATNDVSRVRYQASDWLVRTVRLLRELKPVQRFLEIPAVSRIRQKQNSSLSQRIFLAGTDTLVSDFNFYLKSLSNQINNYYRSALSLTHSTHTRPHISPSLRDFTTI